MDCGKIWLSFQMGFLKPSLSGIVWCEFNQYFFPESPLLFQNVDHLHSTVCSALLWALWEIPHSNKIGFCLHSFILTHESIMWDMVDISPFCPSTTFSRLQVKPLSPPEIYVPPTGGPAFPAPVTSDQHWLADTHPQILEGSLRIHSAEVRQ